MVTGPPRSWTEVSVIVPGELADAVASHLIDLGSPGLASEEHGTTVRLVAYFESDAALAPLRSYLESLGIDGVASLCTRRIAAESWADNWKLHFPPIEVGRALYVCPPWDETRPAGRKRVVIHPGLAFGTGQHPTTRSCLILLERWLPRPCERALDVGCGSGILAITLAVLGVPEVVAVDTDPLARTATAENAERNRVAERIRVHERIEDVGRATFPLLAANLQLETLVELEPQLRASAAPGGVLVASGLLAADAAAFHCTFSRWREVDRLVDGEWITFALRFSG